MLRGLAGVIRTARWPEVVSRPPLPTLPSANGVRWASRATKKQRERQQPSRWMNLAKPAKMKRVLSLCDFWFGKQNLPRDHFIVNTMSQHDGWMPVHVLLSFPKMEKWVDEATVIKALDAFDRYETSRAQTGAVCFRPSALGHAWREAAKQHVPRDVRAAAAAGLETDEGSGDETEAAEGEYDDLRQRCEAARGRRIMEDAIGIWAPRRRSLTELEEDHDEMLESAFWMGGGVADVASPRPKKPSLPSFKFGGAVRVVRTRAAVAEACKAVRDSLTRIAPQADGATASATAAIGFDVEYATLEEDLRPRERASARTRATRRDAQTLERPRLSRALPVGRGTVDGSARLAGSRPPRIEGSAERARSRAVRRGHGRRRRI